MMPCLNPVTANMPDPEDYISLAARHGFVAVDQGANYWADWVRRTSIEHALAFCAEKGCCVGHGNMPVNFREDDAAFETDMAAFPEICAINKAFGIRGMATWMRPTTPGDVAEWRAVVVKRLKRVAAVLADHGLKLGLEWVAPKTSRTSGNAFIYDMPGMLDLCAEIDDKACGLLVDSYHLYTSHASADALRKLTADKIVHVHINDAYPGPIDELMDLKRLLPGEGVIDLDGFLGALHAIGYDGPVAVETFSEELKQIGPEAAAERAGKAMLAVMKPYL